MFTRLPVVRAAAAACTALLLSASVVAGQTPAPQSGSDRGLVWKFERQGKTGWLVGSLHMIGL